MRVLVTRPHPAAAVTMRKLEDLGHQVTHLPLMQASHDPDAAIAALKQPHSAIAMTSAEAVRVLATLGTALQPHLATPVYCVGTATAQAASRIGFSTVHSGPGDGSGLARQIVSHGNADTRLLYLAGHPRGPDFERRLQEAQIACRTAQIYAMTPVAYPDGYLTELLESERIEAVLLYSTEAARRFSSLLGRPLPDLTNKKAAPLHILCLSSAIAAVVPPIFASIVASKAPDDDSLLRLFAQL